VRVLIAEDDPVIALGLETKLASLGHEVVARVADGRRAVEEAARTEPDAVVMDVVMPGVDGLEAACAITRDRPVPIVAITAHDQPEYLARAIRCGVAAYLVKPVDGRQVDRALRLAVSRHREFEAMRNEVGRLQEALETRRLVERAKGILMDRSGLSEGDAFLLIQRRARDNNRTMADVARQLIAAAEILP
jgi:AmiR/NasT family two-component response regulator